ncbi:OLC1v1021762C6 [Oldenlandia corymbosa var. corymbosa]|uniref:OLC1v1021762C6 n=1 Tax=Oldenlandia corymbosa var. corymbosa TaxID=529605 RepID=A0AAV1BYZ4_OLDCO|nr:OLC1v1021762C6 [Oldenlandia corymbosa var. corymbosa]
MDLLRYSAAGFRPAKPHPSSRTPPPHRGFIAVRSSLSLPFTEQKAAYFKELEAAVGVVERACRLCVNVQKTLLSSDGRILEKTDDTPVTIADFGVQALVSLEMSKLFPSIPLVAEEDSMFLRSNNLVDAVVNVVNDNSGDSLTQDEVLEAIDRGGKDAYSFGPEPATYWILDPIDGTRGFVKGSDALYVVGLALVVNGQIVLGVMGCPNWRDSLLSRSSNDPMPGVLMISHIGCGTWRKTLWLNDAGFLSDYWNRCFVDDCDLVQRARFCIPESQTWKSLPLSALYNATSQAENIGNKEILLLRACCGSLCKYLLVASGGASVFYLHVKAGKLIKVFLLCPSITK